jgi:phosphoenolpyruvate-protein phosphotransferase
MAMRSMMGVPASSGVARGSWIRVTAAAAPTGGAIDPAQADREIERLVGARDAAAAELEALGDSLADAGRAEEGEIFGAQAMMAIDPMLLDAASSEIRAGHDAVGAIRIAARGVADQLSALGDELLAARAADVLDVAERIAARLAGIERTVTLDQPAIAVAEDIPPSVAASLPRDRLLGLALEAGSPTSHAAILARAFGIPAVVGVRDLMATADELAAASLAAGDASPSKLVIDGDTGEVVFDPDAATSARLETRAAAAADAARVALAEADLPSVTRDGVEVTLLANIGTPAESARAVELGARGVGLFRTEFLFVERPSPPSEDEQTRANRDVIEAFAPGPVTIRLLDVGGDKPIPYLPIAPEANPFLGVRALRLAPERPELFLTQLRAAMRAAVHTDARPLGRVKVMAPMVADAPDVDVLLGLADQARASLVADGVPHGEVELGVMLEIPSAVLVAASYLGRLGFASLGTNDLTQYTLAADRGNAALERYRDPLHPAVLQLIARAAAASESTGAELSVCGEMAGDPAAALALVGLGVTVLSMAASSLAPVRRAIRAADAGELRQAAQASLTAASASEVRARFAALLPAAG